MLPQITLKQAMGKLRKGAKIEYFGHYANRPSSAQCVGAPPTIQSTHRRGLTCIETGGVEEGQGA
jgi:hypothetical protein